MQSVNLCFINIRPIAIVWSSVHSDSHFVTYIRHSRHGRYAVQTSITLVGAPIRVYGYTCVSKVYLYLALS